MTFPITPPNQKKPIFRPAEKVGLAIGGGIAALCIGLVAIGAVAGAIGDPDGDRKPAGNDRPTPGHTAPTGTTVADATGAPSTTATPTTLPAPTSTPTTPAVNAGVPNPPAPPTTRRQTPPRTTAASVYYANCTEAKAAGAAPLYRGVSPGYRPALDRDGDGVACEK